MKNWLQTFGWEIAGEISENLYELNPEFALTEGQTEILGEVIYKALKNINRDLVKGQPSRT